MLDNTNKINYMTLGELENFIIKKIEENKEKK